MPHNRLHTRPRQNIFDRTGGLQNALRASRTAGARRTGRTITSAGGPRPGARFVGAGPTTIPVEEQRLNQIRAESTEEEVQADLRGLDLPAIRDWAEENKVPPEKLAKLLRDPAMLKRMALEAAFARTPEEITQIEEDIARLGNITESGLLTKDEHKTEMQAIAETGSSPYLGRHPKELEKHRHWIGHPFLFAPDTEENMANPWYKKQLHEVLAAPIVKLYNWSHKPLTPGERGTTKDFVQRILVPTTSEFKEAVSAFQEGGAFEIEGRLVSQAVDTLDVYSQTGAELLFDPIFHARVVKPSILTGASWQKGLTEAGGDAALKKWKARPVWEQVVLGFLDPWFAFSVTKGGSRLLIKAGPRMVNKYSPTAAAQLRRETAKVTKAFEEEALEAALKDQVKMPPIANSSTFIDTLEVPAVQRRITPGFTWDDQYLGRGLVSKLQSFVNPSALIHTLQKGSPERLIREAGYLGAQIEEISKGHVTTIMARVFGDGNFSLKFGLRPGEEARAYAITDAYTVAQAPPKAPDLLRPTVARTAVEMQEAAGGVRWTDPSTGTVYTSREMKTRQDIDRNMARAERSNADGFMRAKSEIVHISATKRPGRRNTPNWLDDVTEEEFQRIVDNLQALNLMDDVPEYASDIEAFKFAMKNPSEAGVGVQIPETWSGLVKLLNSEYDIAAANSSRYLAEEQEWAERIQSATEETMARAIDKVDPTRPAYAYSISELVRDAPGIARRFDKATGRSLSPEQAALEIAKSKKEVETLTNQAQRLEDIHDDLEGFSDALQESGKSSYTHWIKNADGEMVQAEQTIAEKIAEIQDALTHPWPVEGDAGFSPESWRSIMAGKPVRQARYDVEPMDITLPPRNEFAQEDAPRWMDRVEEALNEHRKAYDDAAEAAQKRADEWTDNLHNMAGKPVPKEEFLPEGTAHQRTLVTVVEEARIPDELLEKPFPEEAFKTFSVFDAEGNPMVGVRSILVDDPTDVAATAPGLRGSIAEIEIVALDKFGRTTTFSDFTKWNTLSNRQVMEIYDVVMEATGTSAVQGTRIKETTAYVERVAKREAALLAKEPGAADIPVPVDKGYHVFTREMVDKRLSRPTAKPAPTTYKLDKSPYFGDVMKDRAKYVLTTEQRELLDEVHEYLDEALKMAQAEGIDITELGSLIESFYYFPRMLTVDGKTSLELVHSSRPNEALGTGLINGSIHKHRILEMMEEYKPIRGAKYAPVEQTFEAYMSSIYKEIARQRQLKHLDPILHGPQAARATVLRQAKVSRNRMKRMDAGILNVVNMARGFVPSGATRMAMIRAYPQLQERINTIMKFNQAEIKEIVRETVDKQKSYWTDAKGVLNKTKIMGFEEALDREQDVGRALSSIGFGGKAEVSRIAKEISISNKIFTADRLRQINALRDRMYQWREVGAVENQSAQWASTRAKQAARRLPIGEAPVPLFGPSVSARTEIAKDIEKVLIEHGSAVWKAPATLANAVRQLRTIIDFGAPFIQGLPVLFLDPERWGRATLLHYKAFGNPAVRARYIKQNSLVITEMLNNGGMIGGSEFTGSLQRGGFLAKLENVGVENGYVTDTLGAVVRGPARRAQWTVNAFSSSFETFMDVARVEMWKGLRASAHSTKDLQDLGRFVNELTGTTNSRAIGIPLSQRQFEQAIPFFAPRYLRAIAGLTFDVLGGGLRGQQARRAYVHLLSGIVAVHVAGAAALGQEPHLDPTKPSEFLAWEMFGQYIKPGSKPLTVVKLLAKITRTTFENPDAFLDWNVLDPQDYKDNPFLGFIRNQMASTAGTAATLITGADPLGKLNPELHELLDLTKFATDQTSPFWIGQAVESLDASNPLGSIAGGVSEFTGLTSHAKPTTHKLYELLDKYAQQDYGHEGIKDFEDLRDKKPFKARAERQAMMDKHPDLKEMQAVLESEDRDKALSQRRVKQRDERAAIEVKFIEDVNLLTLRFDAVWAGNESPIKFRQEWATLAAVRRDALARNREQYDDVYKAYTDAEKSYEEISEDDGKEMAAMQHFFDLITSTEPEGGPINPITGETDHFVVDDIRLKIDEWYGEGTMKLIDNELAERKASVVVLTGQEYWLSDRALEYIESFSTLQPYWQAYKSALPEEQHAGWVEFARKPDFMKEMMLEDKELRGPNMPLPWSEMDKLVKEEQEKVKRENPHIDMTLMIFYNRQPTNPENIQQGLRDAAAQDR